MTDHVDDPGHQHTAPDHACRAVEPIPVLRLNTARGLSLLRFSAFALQVIADSSPDRPSMTLTRAALTRMSF
jgi:hypothetical protein